MTLFGLLIAILALVGIFLYFRNLVRKVQKRNSDGSFSCEGCPGCNHAGNPETCPNQTQKLYDITNSREHLKK